MEIRVHVILLFVCLCRMIRLGFYIGWRGPPVNSCPGPQRTLQSPLSIHSCTRLDMISLDPRKMRESQKLPFILRGMLISARFGDTVVKNHRCEPYADARRKVGDQKIIRPFPVGNMDKSVRDFIEIQPVAVGFFQWGSNFWTDRVLVVLVFLVNDGSDLRGTE